MTPKDEAWLEDLVNRIDDAILLYQDTQPPHNITAALLSRVVLLMQADPSTGKDLLRYVWEQLDAIEQGNPGDYL